MLVVATAIVIVIGIAGTLLPFVPGIGLVWVAILVYAIVDGIGTDSWVVLMVVSVVGLTGIALGFLVPQKAANDGGLGWRGQVFATGLAVVGFFVIPILGAPIGFILGVYLAMVAIDRSNASSTTKATLLSFLVASGIQLGAATVMALVWAAWVFAG